MRTLRRILVLLVVLSLPLGAAAGAAAKKPAPPPEEPGVGMTCAELKASPPAGISFAEEVWNEGGSSFTVQLNKGLHACVDVNSVAGEWTIDVDLGSAATGSLAVYDSVMPGDACWGKVYVEESGTVVTSVIPAATIDACGIGELDGAVSLAFSADYLGRGKLAQPVTITVTLP
ncbi:MAG: hypothetical protein JW785_08155 [Acidimicrobiia bacterium]|nr:hypothetical protein [Acidimicrobiia bacterium]